MQIGGIRKPRILHGEGFSTKKKFVEQAHKDAQPGKEGGTQNLHP